MTQSQITGAKIKQVRTSNKLTQKAFGEVIGEHVNRPRPYTIMCVSAWETGRQAPPSKVLTAISNIFGVTSGFLLGDEAQPAISKDKSLIAPKTSKIQFSALKDYNGKPVFVIAKNKKFKDQWVLVDFPHNRLILANGSTLSLSDFDNLDVELHAIQPFGGIDQDGRIEVRSLTTDKLLKQSRVYVSMLTYDEFVRGRYNGWYFVDSKSGCLIGPSGNILPFEGLGYSYAAFINAPTIVI